MKTIQEVPLDNFLNNLRLVRQYSPENVLISLEEVTPTSCKPLRMIINPQRLVSTECLLQAFLEFSIRPYHPVKFTPELEQKIQKHFPQDSLSSDNRSSFFIVPPIIEVHDGNYCIIDGLHRLSVAKLHGIQNIFAIVIRDVAEILPADPVEWEQISFGIASASLRKQKFTNYKEMYWRDLPRIYSIEV